jgi:hypothetical protein
MGNTPNNNFPYPEPTDLVKDGAQAIEDLAASIDTKLGVYVPSSPGLTKINTTNFTAVSSIAFPNNIFSATYDNYKIVFTSKPSTPLDVTYRLRVAGTDNSTASSYGSQRLSAASTTVSGVRYSSNLGTVAVMDTTSRISAFSLELYQPFVADTTAFFSVNSTDTGSGAQITIYSGFHNQTVSYDSINFIASSGNFTGSMSVFGYQK